MQLICLTAIAKIASFMLFRWFCRFKILMMSGRQQTFLQLALNETDQRILFALLKEGRAAPPHLAALTDIPRTTVYSSLKKLAREGLVSEERLGGKIFYSVSSQEDVDTLIVQEERQFKEKIGELKVLQKIFAEQQIFQEYAMPRFQFISDEKLEAFLFDNIKRWTTLRGKTLDWWGYQDPSFVEYYSAWIDAFWKQAPEDLELRFLTKRVSVEESFKVTKRYPNRHTRYTDEFPMDASLWIMGPFSCFLYTQKKPHYAILIESMSIAESLRGVVKKLWALSA